MRELAGQLGGLVELAPGTFTFTDGTELRMLPRSRSDAGGAEDAAARRLLESIPGPVIRRLQGFVMQGVFEADVAHQDRLRQSRGARAGGQGRHRRLQGAARRPRRCTALVGAESITQLVEVPAGRQERAARRDRADGVPVGPDNPDFVPYDQISPYLISVDHDHRGQRLLQAPRLGHARSSSTALEAQPAAAAASGWRRLVDHHADGEERPALAARRRCRASCRSCSWSGTWSRCCPRNASSSCTSTPSSSGRASTASARRRATTSARTPSDLTPLEGAFFSSILPSPKRRYIQYCHGQLLPAVGQVRAAHPGQGARARPADRRGVQPGRRPAAAIRFDRHAR